jgi:hypothetical protein
MHCTSAASDKGEEDMRHTCITHAHTHTYARMHVSTQARTLARTDTRTYVCVRAQVDTHTHVHMLTGGVHGLMPLAVSSGVGAATSLIGEGGRLVCGRIIRAHTFLFIHQPCVQVC